MKKTVASIFAIAFATILFGCAAPESSNVKTQSLGKSGLNACFLAEGDRAVIQGTLIIGHEVRAFKPEGCSQSYWVVDKTGELYERYDSVTGQIKNGTPLEASLLVENTGKAKDGFAKNYPAVFEVHQIISMGND